MKLIVAKFGGTSLSCAAQFEKAAKIVKSDADRKYIIVSAPGKRYRDDMKITDLLYSCANDSKEGACSGSFALVRERFDAIVDGLGLKMSLRDEYTNIFHHLGSSPERDYIASRGEYLSAKIMADYLGYDFIDASDIIFFSSDGTLDTERTNAAVKKELALHKHAVIPGFYGATPSGRIKTFSRGGSDITGAIIASAVNADMYENWTDVSGFLMADPKVVENPRIIERITYRELRELSYMGAAVLHEDAILPVRLSCIPINIKNTNDPEAAGTLIIPAESKELPTNAPEITGITGKKGFCAINVVKESLNFEVGTMRRILSILEEKGISVDHIPTGIDMANVIVRKEEVDGRRDYLLSAICQAIMPDSVSIVDGIALVAVVGRGLVGHRGIAQRILCSVTATGANIKLMSQCLDETNIIIGIDEKDFEKVINSIYNEFNK